MYKARIHHWSCSKFANWLRGEKKPAALTLEEWEEWRKNQKTSNFIRYWLAEKFLTKAQNFFYFPYDVYNEINHYIRNRFITKTHYLKTGLEPGQYHELDTRIIHGLFNELVDFVEIEQAWLNHICGEKKFKFKKGRSPEAGVDYLHWASKLIHDENSGVDKSSEYYGKPTRQAQSAIKILEIYNWWKNIRPNRSEPMDISGWSDYCKNKKNYTEDQVSLMLDKLNEIEEQYDNEDENMMIELIKIRKSLWT